MRTDRGRRGIRLALWAVAATALVVAGCSKTTTSTRASSSPSPTAIESATAAVTSSSGDTRVQAAALVAGMTAPLNGRWVPDMSFYDPSAILSPVVGTVKGATASSPEQIFFFHEGHYLGTATSEAQYFSLRITSVSQGTVVVHFPHYKPADADCCPSQPDYVVRFQWNGHAVRPLDPLPPAGQGQSSGVKVVTGEVGFISPSGNIICGMVKYASMPGGSVRCDTGEHDWALPPRPSPCIGDWTGEIGLGYEGAPTFGCESEAVTVDPHPAPLAYGSALQDGSLICSSSEAGITCSSQVSGHGFFVSRQSYRLF